MSNDLWVQPCLHVIDYGSPVAGLAVQVALAIGAGFEAVERLQRGQERIIARVTGDGQQALEELGQVAGQRLPAAAGRGVKVRSSNVPAGWADRRAGRVSAPDCIYIEVASSVPPLAEVRQPLWDRIRILSHKAASISRLS
jgi:hypothetical protein